MRAIPRLVIAFQATRRSRVGDGLSCQRGTCRAFGGPTGNSTRATPRPTRSTATRPDGSTGFRCAKDSDCLDTHACQLFFGISGICRPKTTPRPTRPTATRPDGSTGARCKEDDDCVETHMCQQLAFGLGICRKSVSFCCYFGWRLEAGGDKAGLARCWWKPAHVHALLLLSAWSCLMDSDSRMLAPV